MLLLVSALAFFVICVVFATDSNENLFLDFATLDTVNIGLVSFMLSIFAAMKHANAPTMRLFLTYGIVVSLISLLDIDTSPTDHRVVALYRYIKIIMTSFSLGFSCMAIYSIQ